MKKEFKQSAAEGRRNFACRVLVLSGCGGNRKIGRGSAEGHSRSKDKTGQHCRQLEGAVPRDMFNLLGMSRSVSKDVPVVKGKRQKAINRCTK